MPRLFLRVLSDANPLPDGEGFALGVEWLIKENDGSIRGSGVTDYRGLADVADPNVDWLTDPENTIVLVPSQMVLTVTCEVPGRSAAQIRRALPFAVEEFVATDIERMHIAAGTIKPGEPISCAIVERTSLVNWVASFRALGIEPGIFVADAQLLATEDGTASVLFDGDGALVATTDQAAMVDRGTLVFALNAVSPEKVIVVNGELTQLERDQLQNAPTIEAAKLTEYGVLDYLADRFNPNECINLLQGEFKPIAKQNPHATKWMSVAALAALWVVVGFGALVVEAFWSASEAQRLEQESLALFKQFAPRESQPATIDALRRRVSSKLGRSVVPGETGRGGFVALTAQFANSLDPETRVTSLRYQARNDEVTAEVILSGYEAITEIQKKGTNAGIAVEVASAEEEGGKVRSRLRVKQAD